MTPFEKRTPLQRLMYLGGVVKAASGKAVERTATGNPLTFTTDLAKPLKSIVANFLPVQSGTGDPSPTNIRPITGWTGVNVGKNTDNTVTVTWDAEGDGKYIGKNGGVVSSANYHYSNLLPVSVGDYAYTFSVTGTQTSRNTRVHGYNSSGEWVKQLTYQSTQNGVFVLPFTVDSDVAYIRVSNIKVATDDTVCVPESCPVTWQTHGTIYGGYVDMVTGEVWKTYRKQVFDGDETLNEYGSYTGGIRLNSELLDDAVQGDRNAKANEAVIEWNVPSTIERLGFRIGGGSGKLAIFIPDSMFDGEATADKFKTWLSENNLEICYTLAEPVLITTLTPQQINAIKGNNTVWSDANGNCEVTFLKKG